jgi:hypothetical protein
MTRAMRVWLMSRFLSSSVACSPGSDPRSGTAQGGRRLGVIKAVHRQVNAVELGRQCRRPAFDRPGPRQKDQAGSGGDVVALFHGLRNEGPARETSAPEDGEVHDGPPTCIPLT